MNKILLFPRYPCPAYQWTSAAPFALREKIGDQIKPRVADNGETSYYFGEEWLQDGAFIVEILKGMFVLMTEQEVDKRFVR